jgi:hypothetical protein
MAVFLVLTVKNTFQCIEQYLCQDIAESPYYTDVSWQPLGLM